MRLLNLFLIPASLTAFAIACNSINKEEKEIILGSSTEKYGTPVSGSQAEITAFSEGTTDGFPAKIVRVKWNTEDAKGKITHCCYVHLAYNKSKQSYPKVVNSDGAAANPDCVTKEIISPENQFTGKPLQHWKFGETVKKWGYTGTIPADAP